MKKGKQNVKANKNLSDGIDEFLKGINEDQVNKEMLHIEVTTHDVRNIDFITYDASGDKVHLILHVNNETLDIHVEDANLNRIIINSYDELRAFSKVLEKIVRQVKYLNDVYKLAEYYKNK